MKVFTCTNFKGVWPVGVAAVVVAASAAKAKEVLRKALKESGLGQQNKNLYLTMEEVDTNKTGVNILNDGEY